MRLFFFALLLLPSYLFSQVDSLKSLLDFYPLHNGNYWEYEIITQQIPYPADSSAFSVEVLGDTLLNNNIYKILLFRDIFPNHYVYYNFDRVDSVSGYVFRYRKDTSLINNEFKIYNVYAQPGDTISTSIWGSSLLGYFRTFCTKLESTTLFGVSTQVKTYFESNNIPSVEYQLAKGFGLFFESSCEMSCGTTLVVYANINGKEYGKKIITGVNNDNISPTSFNLFQNYPNPFNPNTNILFELPEAGEATVNFYNTLGKLIMKDKLSFSNGGLHKIKFIGVKLSSGIYFCKLEYRGKIKVIKMLLVK